MIYLIIAILLLVAYGLGVWSAPWFKRKAEPEIHDLLNEAAERLDAIKLAAARAYAVVDDKLTNK